MANHAVETGDEETPLLHGLKGEESRTPLPVLQIGVVSLLQMCEPLTSQSIYPYINQLISELGITGGDDRKIGYYAGMIESLFFVAEAMTVLQWSRLSDHMGRKPVLLIGLAGTIMSMLCFGVSTTFWGLVASRCLTGLLNGNIGVMKSAMGELTDSTNRAEAVALLPVVWATGATLGPLMGGSLSHPHERFPNAFSAPFWQQYPYFLPCVATSSFVFISFVATLFFFDETVPRIKGPCLRSTTGSSDSPSLDYPCDEPLPICKLLTYPVLISISNYVAIAFLSICFNALFPLFFATPVELGGLGLDPPSIGVVMGVYGAGCGILQVMLFARTVRYFGERTMFIVGVCMAIPILLLFPIISAVAQRSTSSLPALILLAISLLSMSVMDMAFGCVFIYIIASAPNQRCLGAINGLSQTSVSIARAIGPALSTSLFAWSVQNNVLGGHGIYAILLIFAFLALALAARLPAEVWEPANKSDRLR